MIKHFGAVLLLLALAACIPLPAPPIAPSGPPSAQPDDRGLNVVVKTQGALSLKRVGWSEFAPALFGTQLRRGDLLRLDATAQATIACADLTVVTVPVGVGPLPCKASQPVLEYQGKQILTTRAGNVGNFPLLIGPRATKQLDSHPTIRWMPLSGATGYHVSVKGQGVDWSADTGKTEMRYPDTAPLLAPGQTYQVIVSAGGHTSDDESVPGRGFTMLQTEDAAAIRATENKIRALNLGDAPTRLLIADLYGAHDLNAEAIEQIETLATSSQEPAMLRLSGDLYVKTGVLALAEQRYLSALDLSQQQKDVEGQGWMNFALGQVYQNLGNKTEAVSRLEQSQALYKTLGDQTMLGQIQQLLTDLKR